MAESLAQVYDALLLEHIRQAHNYGLAAGGAAVVEISNPMCGDTLQLQADWHDDHLVQARFECECCGIAMGNASLMTLMLAGLPRRRVAQRAREAVLVLQGNPLPDDLAEDQALETATLTDTARTDRLAGWQLLAGIARQLPARLTCASLAWQAMAAALAGDASPVAVEIRRT